MYRAWAIGAESWMGGGVQEGAEYNFGRVICRERGPTFSDEELDRIEALKRSDEIPEDKWAKR